MQAKLNLQDILSKYQKAEQKEDGSVAKSFIQHFSAIGNGIQL